MSVTQSDHDVSDLVEEYRDTFINAPDVVDFNKFIADNHDWSYKAAAHLLSLARQNGIFMLRNALAIAIVMDIEDGDLGF